MHDKQGAANAARVTHAQDNGSEAGGGGFEKRDGMAAAGFISPSPGASPQPKMPVTPTYTADISQPSTVLATSPDSDKAVPAPPDYNKDIMAASVTLAYIQDKLLKHRPTPTKNAHEASSAVTDLTKIAKMLRQELGQTVAICVFVTNKVLHLSVAQDDGTNEGLEEEWKKGKWWMSTNQTTEAREDKYILPPFYDEIVLDAWHEGAPGTDSFKWSQSAQRHLLRFKAIAAGEFKGHPSGPKPPYTNDFLVRRRIEYLGTSSFPLFKFEAKVAFDMMGPI